MVSRKAGNFVQERGGKSSRIPGLLQGKSQYERYAAGLENNQSRFRAEEEGTRSEPTKKEKRAVKK